MTYNFLTQPGGMSSGFGALRSYSGCSSPKLTLHVHWYIVPVTTDDPLFLDANTLP